MNDLVKFGLPADINLISVIGIGSFGTGAVNYMKDNELTGIDYFVLNSNQSSTEIEQTLDKMKNRLFYHRLVFIIGGANEVSESELFQMIGALVKDFDNISFGILTIPLLFGKDENRNQTFKNIGMLKKSVSQVLLISVEHLLCSPGEASLAEPVQKTLHQIMLTVKTFTDVWSCRSSISIDLNDILSLSFKGGYGIVMSAIASGEKRCLVAFELAHSVFTNMEIVNKAQKFLLYIAYGTKEVTIIELVDLMEYFGCKINDSADMIWSSGFDSELGEGEDVRVTIIATGLELDTFEF